MLQNGQSINGNLSWQNAEQYSWQGFAYIEVPYIFNGKKQLIDQTDTLQYSLVLRVLHQNNYSGAIAITQSTRAKRISYPWDCDCSCSEESTEMIDANLAFEPKWGQLGSKEDIMNEVQFALNNFLKANPSEKAVDQIKHLSRYFEANRMWERDKYTQQLVEQRDSKPINRYIYTEKRGWIDMHHLLYAFTIADVLGWYDALKVLNNAERLQWVTDRSSSFSYEDMPSNFAGIEFYFYYQNLLNKNEMTVSGAISTYLEGLSPLQPTQAPNFDFIPHIINGNVPKNKTIIGFTGELLLNAAREEFCKRNKNTKENIKEAHQKLSYSSPRK